NSVHVNFGTGICARASIRIGDRVRIGPYAMILDTDFHIAGGHPDTDAPGLPVEIGDDVWLAVSVTVLKGARIGTGSVITAGTVVAGIIPEGVIAGGTPARVLRSLKKSARDSVISDEAPGGATAARGETAVQRRSIVELDAELVAKVQDIAQRELGL